MQGNAIQIGCGSLCRLVDAQGTRRPYRPDFGACLRHDGHVTVVSHAADQGFVRSQEAEYRRVLIGIGCLAHGIRGGLGREFRHRIGHSDVGADGAVVFPGGPDQGIDEVGWGGREAGGCQEDRRQQGHPVGAFHGRMNVWDQSIPKCTEKTGILLCFEAESQLFAIAGVAEGKAVGAQL